MKKVLVIGLGLSGRSAVDFLLTKGNFVVGVDRDVFTLKQNDQIGALIDKGMEIFDDKKTFDFGKFKCVVVSPGVDLSHPLILAARRAKVEVIGEVELGFRYCNNYSIGITGTNGKSTITMLITHVLNFCGKRAKAVGNIGTSLTSYLMGKQEGDILVIELSSFQLETMRSKCLDEAIILNISADHLDRYLSFEKYALAKLQIQNCVVDGGKFFVSEDIYTRYSKLLRKDVEVYDKRSDFEEGVDKNILAAKVVASALKVEERDFALAVEKFCPPAHRMEFVAKIKGISFYNDSKATNAEAVIHAVGKVKGGVILIAGGSDKNLSYHQWKDYFKDRVKTIFLIGNSAEKMKKELKDFKVEIVSSLELAVRGAYQIAKPYDNVLLSPGCASFDMFQNYKDRGNTFKSIVGNIKKGEN